MNKFACAGGYIVTARDDESVPINARIVAVLDRDDADGSDARALCAQANAAVDLLAALRAARVSLAKAGHYAGLSGALIEVDAAIAKAEAA